MSLFNIKPDKNKLYSKSFTLDEMHKNKMNHFVQKKNQLPQLKSKLFNITNKLNSLENKKPTNLTNNDIKLKAEYKSLIKSLNDEIYDIENNINEIDYLSKISDIIVDYYDIVENNDDILYRNNPELSKEKINNDNNNDTHILDILNKNKNYSNKISKPIKKKNKHVNKTINITSFFNNKNNSNIDKTKINNNNCNNDKINKTDNDNKNEDNNEDKKKLSRAEYLDIYRKIIDDNYMLNKKNKIIKECEKCNIEKTYISNDGVYVCNICGELESIITETEKSSYKECSNDRPGYPYKRINHFNEWLSQFQAKESTDIPVEVYKKIIEELHKNKIYDFKKLARPKLKLQFIKKILKKLNYQQYYEHTTYIISKLSKTPPPSINREIEEKFRQMFRQIQIPFENNCPKNRINFLSYSYVLYKFCELLELDDLKNCFTLLKSREKLRQQDKIWKGICSDLKWEYIPSI